MDLQQTAFKEAEPYTVPRPPESTFLKHSEEYKARTASAPEPFFNAPVLGEGLCGALFLVDNMLEFIKNKEEVSEAADGRVRLRRRSTLTLFTSVCSGR